METKLEDVNKFYNVIVEFFANYSLQIIGALIIIILGVVFSKYVQKLIVTVLIKNNVDETLSKFASNLVRFLIIGMVIILALGKLGVSIGPFIAALGAISLTAGLAIQGSVSNFAAGIVLVITKPFKIEDTIRINDIYGEVADIKLSYTVLVNEDGEQITIPNKYMIGDVLVNSFAYRIVEGSVGIAYNTDMKSAVNVVKKAVISHPDVSIETPPIVGIEKFNDSSIDIGYRYWVPTKLFFKIQYEVNYEVLEGLREANIEIPFPQREVHILGEENVSK